MARLRLGVALLVPPPISHEIDGLRRACGTDVERIPPHCTLVPPVNVREERLAEALAVLRSAAAATSPFTVTLGPPATFWPDSPVLHLPARGDLAELGRLRAGVFVDPLARALTFPFVPHVTLADEATPERLQAAVSAFGGYRAAVTFDRVHLLEEQRRGDRRRVWRPVADAAFVPRAVVGRGGLELELSVTERLDPEAAAFATREREAFDSGDVGELAPQGLAVTARRRTRVLGAAVGWTSGSSASVSDVVVAGDARRQGIGSHLVAAFLSEAARRGVTLVRTRAQAGGPAEAFWRQRGWVEESCSGSRTPDHGTVALRRDL